jgi:RimJ/RimL family protein N-acetyltransferase
MERLEFHAFSAAQPLFAALSETQPMCASVLAGSYPGQVYVDNAAAPCSALLLTYIESEASGAWAFLVGNPANTPFNQALNAAVFGRKLFDPQTPMMFWTCDPGDWGGQLDAIFRPYPPIWSQRYHFIARQVQYDWRSALPEGFAVEPMGNGLRQRAGLELPLDVATTLEKWQTLAQQGFLARGFQDYGFVTLDMRRATPVISSWATVDFIAGGRGDLGFFTQPDYRQRGLGTIAVAAALEDGFKRGLRQVNWTCEADNPGSYRTAQKLGLERIADYRMAFLLFDEKRHMEIFQETQRV